MIRDLHGGGIGIGVDRDDLDPEALQLDDHLLAEFPGAEHHDLGGGCGEGSADGRG